MNKIFVLVLVVLFTHLSPAQAQPALENPLAMSASMALIQPQEDKAKHAELTLLPERKDTELVEQLSKVKFSYQLQVIKNAPLVFVIPGTGSAYNASLGLALAEKLFNMGYHAVTVDNPINWNFTVSASTSAIPGYPEQDAQDLYRVLESVTQHLEKKHSVRPRSFALSGYSIGGLHSLFLKRLDNSRKRFNFSRVFLVNPPTDLLYAVNALDDLHAEGQKLSPGHQNFVKGKLMNVGQEALEDLKKGSGPEALQKIFDLFGFNNTELAYLVSDTFRSSLRDVIFASQQVKDLGILKNKASRYRMNDRYEEAMQISFKDYMVRLVLPMVRSQKGTGYSIEALNQDSSLYQFADMIKSDTSIFVSHSQDDFILKDSDPRWLQETFGTRALIFPYGGHCGHVAFPQFDAFLFNSMGLQN